MMEYQDLTEKIIGCAYRIYNQIGFEFLDSVYEQCLQEVIILGLKSVRQIITAHELPLVNSLTATPKDVGLILNFGEKKVAVKRKVRALPDESQN